MNIEELKSHMAIARQLVEDAGPISLDYFRKPLVVDDKQMPDNVFDPVTEADRRVEENLREGLAKHFPGYSIVGEEYGSEGDSNLRWVIDPIDGTRAFISGVPAWGVLLGLCDGDECLGGIMHQPYMGETFVGFGEEARFYRGDVAQTLQTRNDARLEDAIVYCTHPFMLAEGAEQNGFKAVAERCRMQRYGGDCYSYALLAHGCVDLVIEGLLQPYDIIPLIPIIRAAGGVVTNLEGEVPVDGGTVIAAANAALHQEAMDCMHGR